MVFNTIQKINQPFNCDFNIFSSVLPKVLEINNDVQLQLKLRFLMATPSPAVYTWPSNDDTSNNTHSDIISRLSCPELLQGRGIKFKFNLEEIEQAKATL